MTDTWLQITVELLGGRGMACEPALGRTFIVGPEHSFGGFAKAISTPPSPAGISLACTASSLPMGAGSESPTPDYPEGWLDESALKVVEELGPGDSFDYVFDLGDDWRHRCMVEPEQVDSDDEYGEPPSVPVPIWGWGSIPDQYGRSARDE